MFWTPLIRSASVKSCLPKRSTRPFSTSAFFNDIKETRFSRHSPSTSHSSFRSEIGRTRRVRAFTERVGRPGIRNQLLFFVGCSTLGFAYAAFETNVESTIWLKKLMNTGFAWSMPSITSLDLRRAQNAEVLKEIREWYAYINSLFAEAPGIIRTWASIAFVSVMQPYADATEGKRLCWKICLLNAAVWMAWKFRKLKGPMMVSFMHNPLSGLSYTLLTSAFSHRSFLHLAFNCLALESFGSAAYYHLLKTHDKDAPSQLESTTAWHFLAFHTSAGVFSGLVSHIVSAKFRYPRLVTHLASQASTPKRPETWAAALAATSGAATTTVARKQVPDILPSLGASGAVYASVVVTALAFPESQVALFIPPTYPISIQWGVGGLIAMDIMGILRGWRYLDHWAHLGGAAFGAAYYAYGPAIWQQLRNSLSSSSSEI